MPSKVLASKSSFTEVLINELGVKTTRTSSYDAKNRSRTWSNTPNYANILRTRSRGQLAELPINGLTEYNYYRDPAMSTIKYLNGPYTGTVSGCWGYGYGGIPNLDDPRFVQLQNKALGKLPARMNGASFNLPLFLAEFRKTVSMVTNAAEILTKAIHEYGNLSKGLSKAQKKDLLPWNKWLEYRYGWRLAVKDIYDGLCTIHDIRTFGIRQRVTATATLETNYKGLTPIVSSQMANPFSDIFDWSGTIEYDATERLFVKLVLNYKESSPALQTLQQLGVTNPMNLLWELIPYSFVVDWFIPVGDYLSSLDRFLGKEFVSGCWCIGSEWDFKHRVTALQSRKYPAITVPSFKCNWSRFRTRYYRRSAIYTFPSTSLPTLNVNVNVNRMTDALAMLLQRKRSLNGFKGNPAS